MSVQGGAKTGDRALMADPWSKLKRSDGWRAIYIFISRQEFFPEHSTGKRCNPPDPQRREQSERASLNS
jgi:hypothetical protein